MKIALDYDGTYTLATRFWDDFISLAIAHGHEVIVATSRKADGRMEREMPIPVEVHGRVPVVYCNHNRKDEICRKAGEIVDVWIDDEPYSCKEES